MADPPRQLSDAERVEVIAALEELKNTACAAQARISVDLDASQRASQAAAGVPASQQGRGVAGQVGLARRESAHRGARHLGLGKVLVGELTHTLTGMSAGWLSEWRATLIARETACLSAEHRAQVDAELCGDRAEQVAGWGDARLVAEVRKLAYRQGDQLPGGRVPVQSPTRPARSSRSTPSTNTSSRRSSSTCSLRTPPELVTEDAGPFNLAGMTIAVPRGYALDLDPEELA
ncbi:MAG TPA: hypothetical protein VFJ09_13860 [Nocardioidaceae bacterium]|nr:hypothetical protein [Nocardioidaceae bacterium]